MTRESKASARQPHEPIPFETDDVLARRIRRVAEQLRRCGLHDFAAELAAVAHVLDPEWEDAT